MPAKGTADIEIAIQGIIEKKPKNKVVKKFLESRIEELSKAKMKWDSPCSTSDRFQSYGCSLWQSPIWDLTHDYLCDSDLCDQPPNPAQWVPEEICQPPDDGLFCAYRVNLLSHSPYGHLMASRCVRSWRSLHILLLRRRIGCQEATTSYYSGFRRDMNW